VLPLARWVAGVVADPLLGIEPRSRAAIGPMQTSVHLGFLVLRLNHWNQGRIANDLLIAVPEVLSVMHSLASLAQDRSGLVSPITIAIALACVF